MSSAKKRTKLPTNTRSARAGSDCMLDSARVVTVDRYVSQNRSNEGSPASLCMCRSCNNLGSVASPAATSAASAVGGPAAASGAGARLSGPAGA
eukprot:scaffold267188_cov32-Tisochrysis_lutea.AAC.2